VRRGAVGDGHGGGDRLTLAPLRAEGYGLQADADTREGSRYLTATLNRALLVELDAQTTQHGRCVITYQGVTSGRRPPAAPIGRN
jgi:hypothetical protein